MLLIYKHVRPKDRVAINPSACIITDLFPTACVVCAVSIYILYCGLSYCCVSTGGLLVSLFSCTEIRILHSSR